MPHLCHPYLFTPLTLVRFYIFFSYCSIYLRVGKNLYRFPQYCTVLFGIKNLFSLSDHKYRKGEYDEQHLFSRTLFTILPSVCPSVRLCVHLSISSFCLLSPSIFLSITLSICSSIPLNVFSFIRSDFCPSKKT